MSEYLLASRRAYEPALNIASLEKLMSLNAVDIRLLSWSNRICEYSARVEKMVGSDKALAFTSVVTDCGPYRGGLAVWPRMIPYSAMVVPQLEQHGTGWRPRATAPKEARMDGQASDRLEPARRELEELESDLLYSAKTHFVAAERYRRYHVRLGLAATLLAATASATVVANVPVVTGTSALFAALASGALTFIHPDDVASTHLEAGRRLAALRHEVQLLLNVELASLSLEVAIDRLRAVRKAQIEANDAAPGTDKRDHELASRRIEERRSGED